MEQVSPALCREMQLQDVDGLLELLRRGRPSLFGTTDDLVYRAVAEDAAATGRPLIVVAVHREEVVGYSIIAGDWRRFQLSFLVRHPVAGLLVIRSRLSRRRRSHGRFHPRRTGDRSGPSMSATPAAGVEGSWRDPTPGIARVIHTAVAPEFRSRGIGRDLKAFYVRLLRRRGFWRVQAHIDADNVPSLALQRTSGWTLVNDSTGVFAYYDLTKSAGETE